MAGTEPPGFLKTVLAHLSNPDHPSNRPYVTLTFAQSLDAKIAGANRQQLILSGKESMVMTHWYVSKQHNEYIAQ
jgi:2,5-diamino-6-(ribosylamino)-4(3H)-pyrimidinone 5'-phosphate reductase